MNQKQGNYMASGMLIGVLAGCVLMGVLAIFGHMNHGYLFVLFGLILGMVIGMTIPKRKK